MVEQKKFLEGTEEFNEENTLSWDEALAGNGDFMKFEEGKRYKIAVQNWKIVEVLKEDYNDKTQKVMQPQLEADVILEDGKEVKKRLSILSKRFMGNAREFLENKDPTTIVYLTVKKIGKDNATNYDIEEYDPSA